MTLSDVVKDGAAEKAGLKKGDTIVSIDGTTVSNVDEFVNYITINVSEFYRNPDQWDLMDKEAEAK